MAASTVTGNTSVVLVSSPQTIIYLSSIGYPGHIVTIKDYTGVASQGFPIVVSTTEDVYFADGSISTLLFTPNSYLTAASKTSTSWQLLNNVGFLTTLSNASINQLTATNVFTTLLSSVQDFVSTSLANNVSVTNSININGDANIAGGITVGGSVSLFSSLIVEKSIYFSSSLFVDGSALFQSTLFLQDSVSVYKNISTLGDLLVGENLTISSSLYTKSLIAPNFLSVQTLTMNAINVGGSLRTAQSMSIGSNVICPSSLVTQSSFVSMSSIDILGATTLSGNLDLRKEATLNTLDVLSSVYIGHEVSAYSLDVRGNLSTGDSLFVKESITVGQSTLVTKVNVEGTITTHSLIVTGDALTLGMNVGGNFEVGNTTSLVNSLLTSSLIGTSGVVHGDLKINDFLSVSSFFSTQGDLAIGGALTIDGYQGVTSVTVKGDSYFQSSIENAYTLTVNGSLSTNAMYVVDAMSVLKDIYVEGTVKTSVLGAPIELILSTLSLSNTLSVKNEASIPFFQATTNLSNQFPMAILAGEGAVAGTDASYIHAMPTARISKTISDTTSVDKKEISSLRVSTLFNANVLSSFVVGTGPYTNPVQDASGYLLVSGNKGYKSEVGTLGIYPTALTIGTGLNGAGYNPYATSSDVKWVAVGKDTTQSNTIKYSYNGISWNSVQSGGFGILPPPVSAGIGNDVLYMSTTFQNTSPPMWIATGWGATGVPSLQYSPDGKVWAPGGGLGVFGTTLYGSRLLFFPSPINPKADGAVALVGGYGGPGFFGVRYSYDGKFWSIPSVASGSSDFACRDITVGSNGNLYAVGYNSLNQNQAYTAGASNFTNGWSNMSNLPTGPGTFNTIAYGNGFYVLGKGAASGNPLTSIWKSANLGVWLPAISGGFTTTVNRIVYNSEVSSFVAVGQTTSGYNVQYSADGLNWAPDTTFAFGAAVSSIALGTLQFPDTETNFFTVNVESRMDRVSTSLLYASSVTVSSVTAPFFLGDSSQLTNIDKFSAEMGVSSIDTQFLAMNSTLQTYGSTTVGTMDVESWAVLSGKFFQSTVGFSLAAGLNADSNANMLYSETVRDWAQSSNPSFRYYGSAVTGNGLLYNPFFVATGADSDPQKTIQYSRDGSTWNPVYRGGFTVPDSDGFLRGNTATYGYFISTTESSYTVVPRWVIGGYAQGTTSTIFYSEDGSNFYSGTGSGETLLHSVTKFKANNSYILGLNSSNYVINSSNGINWNQTSTIVELTAFAYGWSPTYQFAWFGFEANGNLYWSTDQGSNWIFLLNDIVMTNIEDMLYSKNGTGGTWVAVGTNTIYTASAVEGPWTPVFATGAVSQFYSLAHDMEQDQWFAGAEAQYSLNTLWTATNPSSWSAIGTGGFSSATLAYGVGYSLIHTSSGSVYAGGIGSFTPLTDSKPQILEVIGATWPPPPSIYTSTILSLSNTSNVFQTSVYGLAYTSSASQLYSYVGLGDGIVPQKTIARSSNLVDWIPALVGGFSPAGYGAIYYSTANIWIAVGDSPASTATIQYSEDTSSWFATNSSTTLPSGGRAITKFRDTSGFRNRLVAVGKAPFRTVPGYNHTIAYSDDGFTWSEAGPGQGFQYAGYGVAAGIAASLEGVVAVGTPYTTNPSTVLSTDASIQVSWNGVTWFTTNGGFDVAGYGVAYSEDLNLWVAVGENSVPAYPQDGTFAVPQTIKWSSDGFNWQNAMNSFFYSGHAVIYNPDAGVFVATGKATSNTFSILYSSDAQMWYALQSTSSGFLSKQAFGTAFGVFGQQVSLPEQAPFIDFPGLTIYERETRLPYGKPTVRFQSTFLHLNEILHVNLSSQVIINSVTPVGSNTLTVIGDIQTSTLYYRGAEPNYRNVTISSGTVSTLQFTDVMSAVSLITPSWAYHEPTVANYFTINEVSPTNFVTNINDTLYIRKANYTTTGIGINTNNPTEVLEINGTFACSTFSTAIYKEDTLEFTLPSREYITGTNLSILEGPNPPFLPTKNTIYSEPSSVTFNSILSVNVSTQRVGCYTTNPQFDFDVQRAGWISTLTTQRLNTGTLFFTLQSC